MVSYTQWYLYYLYRKRNQNSVIMANNEIHVTTKGQPLILVQAAPFESFLGQMKSLRACIDLRQYNQTTTRRQRRCHHSASWICINHYSSWTRIWKVIKAAELWRVIRAERFRLCLTSLHQVNTEHLHRHEASWRAASLDHNGDYLIIALSIKYKWDISHEPFVTIDK